MSGMARKKRKKVREEEIVQLKYFKILSKLLERLHDVGCERDRAGNRILHMDQYMSLLLLFMFNPTCSSLRALQEASELKKVQRKLKVPRCSLGSLSEAARVFDGELLVELIGELANRLGPVNRDTRLSDVREIITLVDGTWLRTLPKIIQALFPNTRGKSVKAHVHFELLKGVPISTTITDVHTSETADLRSRLTAGRLYVLDRGYADYGLFEEIIQAESSMVCRIRDNAVFEVIEERELSKEALDAGIVRDAVVRLGCKQKRGKLSQPMRIVEIECRPHRKGNGKTGRTGPEQGETILLATDLLDLPVEVVGLIFRYRWQVELFFRFFKHILGCRHLLSTCENGIELQMYAAIIASLLIALWTGRKPTLKTYRMLSWYFSGLADAEELNAHIDGLKHQDASQPAV